MQYIVQGHKIYSRSPYSALMYARALFNKYITPNDVVDGMSDTELMSSFEDRPATAIITNDWCDEENRMLKCSSKPRYWDYEQRKLVDNLSEVKSGWKHRSGGCWC